MGVDQRSVSDYFNSQTRLVIAAMAGHDSWISTVDLTREQSGPTFRVLNFAGSGNPDSAALSNYLVMLHAKYGSDDYKIWPTLEFPVSNDNFEGLKSFTMRDAADMIPSNLRVVAGKKFLGFQTFYDDSWPGDKGSPIVWISRALPRIANEEKELLKVLKKAPMTPFIYEVAI